MFGFFKRKKKKGVVEPPKFPYYLIQHFDLHRLWEKLSDHERASWIELSNGDITKESREALASTYDHLDVLNFLVQFATRGVNKKYYDLSEKLFVEASLINLSAVNQFEIQHQLIELYYKRRDEEGFLEKVILLCQDMVERTEEFLSAMEIKEFLAYKRLAIIYENQGLIQEAVELCEKGLSYGFEDGTKTGFSGRIQKLQKKLN